MQKGVIERRKKTALLVEVSNLCSLKVLIVLFNYLYCKFDRDGFLGVRVWMSLI